MNDFEFFSEEWKKLNNDAAFQVKHFDDYKEDVDRHRRGQLISPIRLPQIHSLEKHFRPAIGDLILITGYPGSGKSEFVRFLCSLIVEETGFRVGAFSPEKKPGIFFDELTKITNKGEDFVNEKWVLFQCKSGMPSIDQLLEQMEEEVIRGVRIFFIDPLNWLTTSSYGTGSFESLKLSLTKMKQFTENNKAIIFYIEHPKTPQANRDGQYPKCNIFMVNMGIMHFNKVDGAIVVHRHKEEDMNGNTVYSQNDEVSIEVAKRKDQKYLGYPGTVNLKYNNLNHTYSDVEYEPF